MQLSFYAIIIKITTLSTIKNIKLTTSALNGED